MHILESYTVSTHPTVTLLETGSKRTGCTSRIFGCSFAFSRSIRARSSRLAPRAPVLARGRGAVGYLFGTLRFFYLKRLCGVYNTYA